MEKFMTKKAFSVLAALIMAISGSVTGFAQYESNSSDDTQTAASKVIAAYADDDMTEEDIEKLEKEQEQAEEFAVENEDPEYGKYLEAMEAAEGRADEELLTEPDDSSESLIVSYGSYGGADTLGYTNDSLIHNSKFDDYEKLWGVDVCYYQLDVDWDKVKADGIDFVIIRAGYRGYGSAGTLVADYKLKTYLQGAKDAGLDIGLYFFTQAITTQEATAEADFVLSNIKGYEDYITMPVYYDIESIDYASGRLDNAGLSKSQKTALCEAFCSEIEKSGLDAGVYSSKWWLEYMIDGASLSENYDIWLAQYSTYSTYSGDYSVWQFSSSGNVDGISTRVDMDVNYRISSDDNDKKAELENTEIEDFKLSCSGSMAKLTWSAVEGASGYEIYRYNSSKETYTKIATTSSAKATISLSNTSYGYCVRAVFDNNGETVFSKYSSIIYARKNKITNLSASTTSSSISLSWDAITNASGYEIYRAASPTGTYVKLSSTSKNSYKITGYTSARGFTFKVRPYFVSSSGIKTYGVYSDTADAVIKPAKGSTPKHVSSTSSSIKISWSAITNVDGYQVSLYDTSTKKYTVKSTVSSETLKVTLSGLSAGTSYKYAVRGYKTYNGKTTYGSYSACKTCATAPATPASVYATVNASNTVKLTWNASDGAEKYTVYKKTDGSYVSVGTTTGTSYTFTDEAASGTRIYAVKANSTVNKLSLSSGYSSECILDAALDSPSIISASTTSDQVTLNWSDVDGATGYRIYKYDTVNKKYVSVKTVSSVTNYTVTSLDSNTAYKFRVKAFKRGTNGILWSKSSSLYKATTTV